jgi:membrane fusion protein, macrolide-specific efflux system
VNYTTDERIIGRGMRKIITRRNIVIALVIGAIIGGIAWNRNRAAVKSSQIETVIAERRDVKKTIIWSGSIKADKQATLNFPAPGKLAYLNVEVGDRVNKWQALAGMDTGDLRAAERAALYRYQSADANAKLVEDQVKNHAADESFTQKNERIAAQTARDIAYDTWLTAKRSLTDSNLFAPFAGVITASTVSSPGDTISVTDGITLVDPGSLYFEIEVDESDLDKIQSGATVTINLDAYPNKEFKGTVGDTNFISSLSSTGATVFTAKVRFDPGDIGMLRVGMNGDGEIILAEVNNVLALPIDSVVGGYVSLADKDKTRVQVETGIEGDEFVEIKTGLSEGQAVLK